MDTFLYFAYGSNMLAERLKARCRSARPRGIAHVNGFDLLFSKRSVDGSGKAALIAPGEGETVPVRIFGVVYEIDTGERSILNRVEGDGYHPHTNAEIVDGLAGGATGATTYIARPDAIEADLQPYDWYMALVLAGARQHGLPDRYIKSLNRIAVTADPDPKRLRRREALRVLAQAGHAI